ncbi:hypothetical protein ACFX2I_001720 [Malus domestica]
MRSNQVRLNCGITMPAIGSGTYSFQNDRKTIELAVHMALKMGYRHFDTAKIYGLEPALGNALTEAMQRGKTFFVTSKLCGVTVTSLKSRDMNTSHTISCGINTRLPLAFL